MIKEAIKKLSNKEDLTLEEAKQAMDEILTLEGGATDAQISSFLSLLRMKGETIDEITGCAITMKSKATHIKPKVSNYIDFVGTGGDSVNTFNITTTSVFVTAAAGVPIAKHGNRSISSKSGSVDLLEALGINVDLTPEQVEQCVNETGMGFMFAKTFHKTMKNAGKVRSEISIRTIFNILGPISNPSDAKRQVIGVFDKSLTNPLANAMLEMGVERGIVVNCEGIDEFTTIGANSVSEIKDGIVMDYMLKPERFGFERAGIEDIRGGTAEENAAITRAVLAGERGPKLDTVLLNAGAGIYIGGKADTIFEGVDKAREIIESGAALAKLNQMIEFTNQF